MKTLVLFLILVTATSTVSAQPSTPKAQVLGPFVLRKHTQNVLYTGLANTLFGVVTKFSGNYRLDFFIGDDRISSVENEPTITITPQLSKDEGKKGILRVSVQKKGQQSYSVIMEETYKIEPPKFTAVADDDYVKEGDPIRIKAWLGPIEDAIPLPAGMQMDPVPGFFDGGTAKKSISNDTQNVQNEFFGGAVSPVAITTNTSLDGYNFEFVPSAPQKEVPIRGRNINIEVTDPFTHQSATFSATILPKSGS